MAKHNPNIDNPLYHDTMRLLKRYRDVVWSLELSVQQIKARFQIDFGSSIDDFLDSAYLAGADIGGTELEHQAKCIERSADMLKLLRSAVETMRQKHKHGEVYYQIIYHTFLTPQQPRSVFETIDILTPIICDISHRTYYRRRDEAIDTLSSILWGYTSKDSLRVLEDFVSEVG